MKAAAIQISPTAWQEFQSAEEGKGSAGLFDPRWHPKVVERAKSVVKELNQTTVDYMVS